MRTSARWPWMIACGVALVSACGGEEPVGITEEGKADAPPTNVTVQLKGTIPTFYGNVRGRLPAKAFYGWTFDPDKGEKLKFSCSAVQSDKRPTLRIYGPKPSSGWGRVIAVAYPSNWWVDLPFTAPASGKYLVVLNEKTAAQMDYELNLTPQ